MNKDEWRDFQEKVDGFYILLESKQQGYLDWSSPACVSDLQHHGKNNLVNCSCATEIKHMEYPAPLRTIKHLLLKWEHVKLLCSNIRKKKKKERKKYHRYLSLTFFKNTPCTHEDIECESTCEEATVHSLTILLRSRFGLPLGEDIGAWCMRHLTLYKLSTLQNESDVVAINISKSPP